MNEARITINGIALDLGQSITLRVAVTEMHARMADPDGREEFEQLGPIGPLYMQRLNELLRLIIQP